MPDRAASGRAARRRVGRGGREWRFGCVIMTVADASIASAGAIAFLGKEAAYWRLRLKGAALLMLTLGLYRFWFATDVRRFLWSNTEIEGDTLEYTGLATELLGGFLIAIAILVPLYTAFAMPALDCRRDDRSLAGRLPRRFRLVSGAALSSQPYGVSRHTLRSAWSRLALCAVCRRVVVHRDHHARARLSLGASEPAAL